VAVAEDEDDKVPTADPAALGLFVTLDERLAVRTLLVVFNTDEEDEDTVAVVEMLVFELKVVFIVSGGMGMEEDVVNSVAEVVLASGVILEVVP